MQRKLAARAAIVSAATALVAGSAIMFSGVALAGGHGHGWGGSDADGGHGGDAGNTHVTCEFHGPVDVGNHTDNPKLSNCSAIGASNGGSGGSGY